MSVRVRIAPSPTGNLHIGTARTTLFNWLFARKNKGQFFLRIEDTDLGRSNKKYEESIIEGLKWLNLQWDEPMTRQSERLDMYKEGLKKLLDSHLAFWCHHTKEELQKEQKHQMKEGLPQRHFCMHKDSDLGKKKGEVIRLNVNGGSVRKIVFQDAIRGPIEWAENLLGDVSLAKDLDTPLYNFAAVMDDIDMQITHVIRGEDHISNTPKQILIYEALGKTMPVFAHLPLILGSDRSKMSKRHGATSIIEYQKDYLPEALNNFMGFLGYTYSKEIMSLEEMAQEFDLAKVHKSGAIFNVEKLNWLNARYVRKLPTEKFKELTDHDVPDATIPLITERLEKLSDIQEFNYFWRKPSYDVELLRWKGGSLEDSNNSLQSVVEIIQSVGVEDRVKLRVELDQLGQKLNNRGLVYWPLRAALTGKGKSPDPVEVAFALGKDEVLNRVNLAIKRTS